MLKGLKETGLPFEALPAESGYFVMVNVEKCRDFLPKKYLESHTYEDDPDTKVDVNKIFMPDGRVPLDLAVVRWLAVEKKVIAMPNCIFYHSKSPYRTDKYIRIAICRGVDTSLNALKRLKV